MLKPFFRKFITPLIQDQKGATLLIAALILALLTVFVATALVNNTSSSVSIGNDSVTKKDFYVSYAALEKMSKEFSDIFTANLSPTSSQLNAIKSNAEDLANNPSTRITTGITLKADIRNRKLVDPEIDLTNGPYSGLKALREEYIFTATAVSDSGVTVELTRSLYNNLIPIFQFGIFSTRHLEFYNGPPFNFGGRVHANKDIYLTPQSATKFSDRVTTTGQITYGQLRNGAIRSMTAGYVQVLFPSTSQYKNLTVGSVNNGPDIPGDPRPGFPAGSSNKTNFDNFIKLNLPGQVFVKAPPLKLPIQNTNNRPIEIIRRGLTGENPATDILAQSRFFFKAGLRITVSDTQADLPGGTGGVQLDSPKDPVTNLTYTDARLGYLPKALGVYQASRINGHRIKGWIKVEVVQHQTDGSVTTTDITQPILALGVTKYDNGAAEKGEVNNVGTLAVASGFPSLSAYSNLNDSNSVLCLQHYSLEAAIAPVTPTAVGRSDGGVAANLVGNTRNNLVVPYTGAPATPPVFTDPVSATKAFPLVDNLKNGPANSDTPPIIYSGDSTNKLLAGGMLIPYPINIYDQREGGALDSNPGTSNVHLNGVFSLIDIDMQNLKKLLTGGFDTMFTAGGFTFQANDIPSESNGWIIYLSDRRGDTYAPTGLPAATLQANHFGKYDMETVYGNTTTVVSGTRRPYSPGTGETLFAMEDTNDNNTIEFPNAITAGSYNTEGALPDEYLDVVDAITKGPYHPNMQFPNTTTTSYVATIPAIFNSTGQNYKRIRLDDAASAVQVPLFRRAVRLSNGTDLTRAGSNSVPVAKGLNINRGITFACENPVYVKDNYNTTGVANSGANTAADYQGNEVPAAIISDSITLLSKSWRDVNSFTSPYALAGRDANNTQYRFAAFTGRNRDGLFIGATDTVKWGTIGNSGTIGPEPDDVRLYGGVHNFLRYLENWGGNNLSYCGSIIDGWDSLQANGPFKCCNTVYGPPTRDYTFNTAFSSVDRLPPGTPNLQYILFTNFRENVNPKQF